MIYVSIAHVDDIDADYFKFDTLEEAVAYIKFHEESEWIISDMPSEEMPVGDYTYVVMSYEPKN